jgi:Ni/Co efflux regulator RcnB
VDVCLQTPRFSTGPEPFTIEWAADQQSKEDPMKKLRLAIAAAAVLAFSGAMALAQSHDRFDDHDQQVTRDWYNQHKDHPPVGFRTEDRLSADEEGRLREGVVLDKSLRRRVHPAPQELVRELPPPARHHRYVAIGGHVGLIDNKDRVKAIIHLHD